MWDACEQLTGATINVAFRLQINALISRVHGVLSGDDLFGKVDPTYLPLLWFERVSVVSLFCPSRTPMASTCPFVANRARTRT